MRPSRPRTTFSPGKSYARKTPARHGARIASDNAPAREHLDRAIIEYRLALRLHPRHYWARYQLGQCLLALGKTHEAVEALSGCLALRPDYPWAYASRGLASGLSGLHEEALGGLRPGGAAGPNFLPAPLNRGVVYWLDDNLDAAKADFDAVLTVGPEKRLTEAAFYRGQLLLNQGRVREAAGDFSMVSDDRPNFQPGLWFRAKANFRLGKFDDGLADLNRFAELDAGIASKSPTQKLLISGKNLRKMRAGSRGLAAPRTAREGGDRTSIGHGDRGADRGGLAAVGRGE